MGAKWTADEDKTIRTFYATQGAQWDGWRELLPNRTKGAIYQRAHKLGLLMEIEAVKDRHKIAARQRQKFRESDLGDSSWKMYEVFALLTYWPKHGKDWAGWEKVLPLRSEQAISNKAWNIQLSKKPRDWALEEDEKVLLDLISTSIDLKRTPFDVVSRINQLRRHWEKGHK